MNILQPPTEIISQAVRVANQSPCQKSKRGVIVFDDQGRVKGWGYNGASEAFGRDTPAFYCDNSSRCRALCSQRCIHAETRAQDDVYVEMDVSYYMLHVKTEDGDLVAGGPPSCIPCAFSLLERGLINGMWLYQVPGEWHYYPVKEFYDLSVMNGSKCKNKSSEDHNCDGVVGHDGCHTTASGWWAK